MTVKSVTAALVVLVVSVLAVSGQADGGPTPNDPVEVTRAYTKAYMAGGDWRVYLSKRWQEVVTPAMMNDLNYFYTTGPNARLRNEQAKTPPEDKNIIRGPIDGVNSVTPDLDDVKLVEATETTAVVDVYLSFTGYQGKRNWVAHRYLIKEDGRWVVDTIFPDIRPDWAMPAELRALRDEIAPIVRQYFSAIFDSEAKPKRDSTIAMEIFARQHLCEESLACVGVKRYVEQNCTWKRLDKAGQDRYLALTRLLSPVVVGINDKTRTVGRTEFTEARACRIVRSTNEKGEPVTMEGRKGFFFVKEHGEWKLLVFANPDDLVARFLELWRDKNTDTMGRLLAPDAAFNLGAGKDLSWPEVSKKLPIPVKEEAAGDIYWGRCARLGFGDGSGCKSGVYEFKTTRDQPTRITSVRYMSEEAIAAAEKQRRVEADARSPKPAPEPVKPTAEPVKPTPKPKWRYGGRRSPVWVSGNHTARPSTKYEMIDLGALAHLKESEAIAINNAGLVVFGNQSEDHVSLFLWQKGKVRVLNNRGCRFLAMNDLGQIAGARITDVEKLAGSLVLLQDGKITNLGAIGKGGLFPMCINNKGQIAGAVAVANGGRPAMWDKGHIRILPGPEGVTNGFVTAINSLGQTVGSASDAHHVVHAYGWTAGKGTDLGRLPTCAQSEAYSINDKGLIVGWSYGPDGWDTRSGDVRSFAWKDGAMKDLGSVLGSNRVFAYDINNRDQVVGYTRRPDGKLRGFVLTDGIATYLSALPGDVTSTAHSINDNGWIIGTSTTADNKDHAVLWRPVSKAHK